MSEFYCQSECTSMGGRLINPFPSGPGAEDVELVIVNTLVNQAYPKNSGNTTRQKRKMHYSSPVLHPLPGIINLPCFQFSSCLRHALTVTISPHLLSLLFFLISFSLSLSSVYFCFLSSSFPPIFYLFHYFSSISWKIIKNKKFFL